MRDARELASCVIDVPLSVLDLSPVAAGTTSGQALRQTTELARRTEELGYRRVLVGAHHHIPPTASAPPAGVAHRPPPGRAPPPRRARGGGEAPTPPPLA